MPNVVNTESREDTLKLIMQALSRQNGLAPNLQNAPYLVQLDSRNKGREKKKRDSNGKQAIAIAINLTASNSKASFKSLNKQVNVCVHEPSAAELAKPRCEDEMTKPHSAGEKKQNKIKNATIVRRIM